MCPRCSDSSVPPKGIVLLVIPEVEVVLGVTILIPKPLLPAWAAESLIVKVSGVVLPNTELLVPLLVIWVVAPEPEVVNSCGAAKGCLGAGRGAEGRGCGFQNTES